MKLIDLAIERVVACSLMAFGAILLGIYSYWNLVVATWPAVDLPTIVVTASLPGASPETMAATVATPLERRLGRLAGVTEISSASSAGNTQITIQFSYSRDIDGAANDVQSALSAASSELPKEMPQRPTYKKVNPSVAPIVLIAVTSKTLPLRELYGFADTVVRQRLSEVEGVGTTALQGASSASIRVSVDPEALASYGLSLEDVQNAIVRSSTLRPVGSFDGDRTRSSLSIDDQLRTSQAFRSLIIQTSSGAPLRLADLATVEEDTSDNRVAGRFNGQPAVFIFVQRKAGSNIVETVEHVKAAMPAIQRWLPAAVDLKLVIDRADEIKGTLDDFKLLLLITVVLVVGLVYLFLKDVSATLIASFSIPVSLCVTFTVLHLLGYGLDVISLLALMLASGFIVDDAVVVIENIARFRDGRQLKEAVALAANHIGFTIVAITLSLVAAFAPFFFFAGIIGSLLREFAVTLCTAIVVSGIVSLTVTPSVCAFFLSRSVGRSGHAGDVLYGAIKGFYSESLRTVLRVPRVALAVTLATVLGTIALFAVIPKGFLPTQDSGAIYGIVDGSPDVSFAGMMDQQNEISRRLMADRDVEDVSILIGSVGTSGVRTARFFVTLKPSGTRDNVRAVIARLKGVLAVLPSLSVFMVPIEDINVGAREGKGQYQYTLRGESWEELQVAASVALESFRALPSIKDVGADYEAGGLQFKIAIDRDRAANLGITPKSLNEALFSSFGQRPIAFIYSGIEQQQIILEMNTHGERDQSSLDRIYLKAVDGSQIPLRAVANITEAPASLAITHQGEFPAITLSFNLADQAALSQAAREIEREISGLNFGAGIRGSFEGQAAAFKSFSGMEPFLLLGAIAAVYIILGILYESYIHPLTIISSLPSAAFGALFALWITRMDLSLIAFIGIVLLIGIVKKNAILIVDFAIRAQNSGLTASEAIVQACEQRVRPIVMTNTIAILTALPLIFATGVGSNVRQPLGVAIVGGLIVSLMLTLYSTPVIYLYLDRWRLSSEQRLQRALKRARQA